MQQRMEGKVGSKLSAETRSSWRELSVNDIQSVVRVADEVHPGLPEIKQVFVERVKLFQDGCLALVEDESNEFCGYAISHPICRCQPPTLNTFLGEISPNADQYYIQDLAILPKLRGRGSAKECIDKILEIAKRFPTTSLISVYGTAPFWNRFGFTPVEINETLRAKLRDYGEDAIYLERQNEQYRPSSIGTEQGYDVAKVE